MISNVYYLSNVNFLDSKQWLTLINTNGSKLVNSPQLVPFPVINDSF